MINFKSVLLVIAALSLITTSLLPATSYGEVKTKGIKAKGFVGKPMIVSSISGVENKEIALINIRIAPDGASPLHTHPGDCFGGVIEGTVEFVRDGEVMGIYSAGQAWANPRGASHYFKNIGDTPARLVNTVIYDKGKKRTQRVKK